MCKMTVEIFSFKLESEAMYVSNCLNYCDNSITICVEGTLEVEGGFGAYIERLEGKGREDCFL